MAGRSSAVWLLGPLVLASSGCSQAFSNDDGDPTVVTWAGPPGTTVQLTPVDLPDNVPLFIKISDSAWELRLGDLWRTAQDQGSLDVSVDADGYWVGASLMLPAGLAVGSSAQGTTVTEQSLVETWYGGFEDALVVDVWAGDFRGSAAFAKDIGPVQLTWQGQDWELVYYERD